MKNGNGICTYANGDIYDGDWCDDQWHGQGTLTKNDGSVTNGVWDNGKLSSEDK
jgi:hypothetical protein